MPSIYYPYFERTSSSNAHIDTKWAFRGSDFDSSGSFSIELSLKDVVQATSGQKCLWGIGSSSKHLELYLLNGNDIRLTLTDGSSTYSVACTNVSLKSPTIIVTGSADNAYGFTVTVGSQTHTISNASLPVSANTLQIFANYNKNSTGTGLQAKLCKCIIYGRKNSSSDRMMVYCGIPFGMQWGSSIEKTFFDFANNVAGDITGSFSTP